MEWMRFLDENNIPYVTRGPNTKSGEVSIKCPMCGNDDPSEHLGINPYSGYWGCLRDQSHRGKSAKYLIRKLLNCSVQQANLVVKQYSQADPDTLETVLLALQSPIDAPLVEDEDAYVKQQMLNKEFADFKKIKPRGLSRRFFKYLQRRGYDNPLDLVRDYDLRCAYTGPYADRIIIPVLAQGELLGWTGRALGSPIDAPRYKESSQDIKTTVWNYDNLRHGGNRLFIVEGPFDAMRLDVFGREVGDHVGRIGYRATCTFGTSVTISQIALLRALVKKFKEAWVLFDQGADAQGDRLAEWLGCKQAFLPSMVDDPGELWPSHLKDLGAKFFNGIGSQYLGNNQGFIFPQGKSKKRP